MKMTISKISDNNINKMVIRSITAGAHTEHYTQFLLHSLKNLPESWTDSRPVDFLSYLCDCYRDKFLELGLFETSWQIRLIPTNSLLK